jgi:hypothetical protein
MKLLSTHFVAPAVLTALSFIAGCSSDAPAPSNSAGAAGSSAAGAPAGGKGGAVGSTGGSGGSVAGGASAGVAGAVSTAGGGSGGTSAAGAGTGGGDAVPATFNTVKEMIRLTPCTGGTCHGVEFVPLHWTADDPMLYEIVTTHVTKNCGKLVNVANPADSALVKVLLGSCGVAPNITARMPFQACWDETPQTEYPCIPPATVAAIQTWIANGAPKQ